MQGGVYYKGGDWMTTNITLPASGVSNMTFLYNVPLGFDDLSAAVRVLRLFSHSAILAIA